MLMFTKRAMSKNLKKNFVIIITCFADSSHPTVNKEFFHRIQIKNGRKLFSALVPRPGLSGCSSERTKAQDTPFYVYVFTSYAPWAFKLVTVMIQVRCRWIKLDNSSLLSWLLFFWVNDSDFIMNTQMYRKEILGQTLCNKMLCHIVQALCYIVK